MLELGLRACVSYLHLHGLIGLAPLLIADATDRTLTQTYHLLAVLISEMEVPTLSHISI